MGEPYRWDSRTAVFSTILRIEKKKFDYFDHKELLTSWKEYRSDDKEVEEFKGDLNEFEINFPPT